MPHTIRTLLVALALLAACTPERSPQQPSTANALLYAKRFSISKQGAVTYLHILYPVAGGAADSVGDTLRYAVVHTAATAQQIAAPVQRLAVSSTTHLPYVGALQALDALVAIDEGKRIHNAAVRALVQQSRVREAGSATGINNELLLAAKTQVLVLSSSGRLAGDKLETFSQLGLVAIPNLEWMETHPLGRAEWIKFFGVLLNKEKEADSIFAGIATRYQRLAQIAERAKEQPTVMTGRSYRGAWYVPRGGSFQAQFFKDAGAKYFWADEPGTGSLPTDLERVYARAVKAQFWVNIDEFRTRTDMLREDARYANFDAFLAGRVYNHNKRINAIGADDYWEAAMLEPDVLLADLIKIFHPELLPAHQLSYYQVLP